MDNGSKKKGLYPKRVRLFFSQLCFVLQAVVFVIILSILY